MGRELRALGGNYFAGVCVNLAPNPRWGRAQESYGEDPLLIGTMGAALSRGASQNVMTCVKHFALNSMENSRFDVNVSVAADVMHECYLPHFRQCLQEGRAESIMTAYNKVNGEYCGESSALISSILRTIWGHQDALVSSDWIYGFRDAVKSVKAGLDIEMPYRSMRHTKLQNALRDGTVVAREIDEIAKRIIRAQLRFQARIANTPCPPRAFIRSTPTRDLARSSASRSMVLLKNDFNLLPLIGKPRKKILVVGLLAKSTQTGDHGSSAVRDPGVISALEALQMHQDCDITYQNGRDMFAIKQDCGNVDLVLHLVGYTARDEGEHLITLDPATIHTVLPALFPLKFIAHIFSWILRGIGLLCSIFTSKLTHGGDRRTLKLNGSDEKLAVAIAAIAGKRLVLCLVTSGPIVLPKALRSQTAGIILVGYGGCQFGNALVDVLLGNSEPAGRLAYGIVEDERDAFELNYAEHEVTFGRWWGYRLGQRRGVRPAFPFGFGLGYGDISFSQDSLVIDSPISSRFFRVIVDVTNQGKRMTSGVVQVYGGRVGRAETDYEKVLLGFARIDLSPGKTGSVLVQCRLDPLAHWNISREEFECTGGRYAIVACRYEGDTNGLCVSVNLESTQWGVKSEPDKVRSAQISVIGYNERLLTE
jgi:beta-glucosidase